MKVRKLSRVQRMIVGVTAALLLLFIGYIMLALAWSPVEFGDAALEATVRHALQRDRGSLATAELERITRLDAEYRGIESLEGIERLAGLEELNLRGNRVADLAPLAALHGLQRLDLSDNGMVDLQAANLGELAALRQLRELSLRHNRGWSHPESPDDHARISDISLLAGLTRLESLDLRDNHVADIGPLAGLELLTRLDLRDNRLQLDDLGALRALSQLEYLNLRNSGISNLSGIEALRNLSRLNLHSNAEIESIEPLSGLPRLRTLIVRNVAIGEQVTVLETLPQLERLNMRNTGVTDLSPLARLMERGALQDDPRRGVYAEVDIRENPVSFSADPDGYAVLAPYWGNISRRYPQQLPPPLSREIIITEVMSSNGSTIDDGGGAYPDWIELYNPAETAFDLSGYWLSDHPYRNTRWQFPDGASIDAGEHLLVWASGRDTVGPDGRYHTDFRISSSGEAAVLTEPDGRTRVDALLIPPLPRDRSYGRRSAGTLELTTFAVPTPGASNRDAHEYRALSFSHRSGFHSDGFELEIAGQAGIAATAADPAPDGTPVNIYYTLDGSLPRPDAVDDPVPFSVKNYESGRLETWYERTFRYDGAIAIGNSAQADYAVAEAPAGMPRIIDIGTTTPNAELWKWLPAQGDPVRGTVVRAAAYTDEPEPVRVSDVVTATFIVVRDGPDRFTLPLVTIATPPSGLFDFDDGIYVPGRIYDQVQPYQGNWMAQQANYSRRWERPAHFEFFESDGSRTAAIDGGVRIHGSFSRSHPLKSLRLYARKDYEVNNYFEHPLFPGAARRDDPHSPIERYKRLILRSGQSLFRSHLQDAVIQHALMDHVEVDMLRYRPVLHFINGEYWGIKNLRERFDRFYIEANYGIDPDEVIVVDGPFGFDSQLREGRPGENRSYFELQRFIVDQDMRDPEHYRRVQREMDVISFIDYNIVRIYSSDRDGVDKHIAAWRKRTDFDPHAAAGHDGRWRWHTWDFDNAMMYHHNTLEYYAADGFDATGEQNGEAGGNADASKTAMVVNLFENDEFRNTFINRFAGLLNTVLQPDPMRAAIDKAAELLAPEIAEHIERWSYPVSVERWRSHVDSHKRFVSERPAFDRDYIVDYFSRRGYPMAGTFTLLLENGNPAGGHIRVEFVDVRDGSPGIEYAASWSGTWFGDVPLRLRAEPAAGFRFAGWTGDLDVAQPLPSDGSQTMGPAAGTDVRVAQRIVIRTDADVRLAASFEPVE